SDHELKSENKDEPIPVRWDRYWKSYRLFRQTFIILTAIWGFGLLIEAIVRLISIIYVKHVIRAKKLIEERKKAAAADATNYTVTE
ncbi:27247_t:CDS:2, partial [Dentiscutata erythropus]